MARRGKQNLLTSLLVSLLVTNLPLIITMLLTVSLVGVVYRSQGERLDLK